MAETQASAQEQPTEGTTQSPALPPLPDFLQRHSVRTVKQNGEDRTFIVLNHYPLSFQNQEKKAIQELFVEFWLDRQTLQVFVVVNWMSPVGQATTNIFPRAALFGEASFLNAMANILNAGLHINGEFFEHLRLMMTTIDPFNGVWATRKAAPQAKAK